MLMELAYRLAVEETPLYDQILKNVIVMISAAAEPDGRDRYTDWYYKYKLTEENEQNRVPGPPYWGKYIFHDNNRDINYSQVTMRNWLKFYLAYRTAGYGPRVILYNHASDSSNSLAGPADGMGARRRRTDHGLAGLRP